MFRALSAEEKKAYNSIKRSEEAKNLSGREEEVYPIYLKIKEIKKRIIDKKGLTEEEAEKLAEEIYQKEFGK